MTTLSPRLRRLDRALAELPAESEAMLLGELDGYVAGLLVCPDLILPGEWLPLVWGGDGDAWPFDDTEDARWYVELVTAHYNDIARTLGRGPGRYAPLFDVDVRHDEVLWELWIEGFDAAMRLRPDGWSDIVASGDEAAIEALAGMTTLIEIAQDESDLMREAIDAFTDDAPDLIPAWVERLHAWRLEHRAAPPSTDEPRRGGKIGRNEACRCGSGKKYKKCCGLN